MAASGTTPHASAWTHWARPISDPSAQTIELLDMFCALNGATDTPLRASHRHSPAVTRLLPASDVVPATSSPLDTTSPHHRHSYRSEGRTADLRLLRPEQPWTLRSRASGCCAGCAQAPPDRAPPCAAGRTSRSVRGAPSSGRTSRRPGCPPIDPTPRPCLPSPTPARPSRRARAVATSGSAGLHLDERRLDNRGQDVAATYVDDDLVALLGARSEQRQSDSLLQGRRERPGGDFTQHRAVCALDLAVRTRNPTAGGQQTPGGALRARSLLCHERVLAPERVFLPANGPAGPSLHRSDVQAQLMAVQRVAHLGAQGIARTQTAGQPVIRGRSLDQRVPESQRVVPARDQLVATFACVAGAADDDRLAVPVGLDERHVLVAGRQTKSLEDLVALVALDRDDAVPVVQVLDLQTRGRCRLQPAYDLSGVGGVGDEEDVVLGAQVDDEVIDHPAGLVAAQGVLRLALVNAAQVIGQAGVDERRSAGAPTSKDRNPVTTLTASDRAAADLKGDALVLVSVHTDDGAALASGHGLGDETVAHVESALSTLKAKGDAEEVLKLVSVPGVAASLVIVSGAGKAKAEGGLLEAEAIRRAVGAATRQLSGLSKAIVLAPGSGVEEAVAAAEGAVFGAYTVTSSAAATASSCLLY